MSLAERIGGEIKGDHAVAVLQQELSNLFTVQRSMLATDKTELFHIALRDVKGKDPYRANRDFFCQFRSIPYLGHLKKESMIKAWLLPEPGSLLTSMWVNKVIITNDFRAIALCECLSYRTGRNIRQEVSSLYQRPSNDIVSTLVHGTRSGGLSDDAQMIDKIGNILAQTSGLPLLKR